MREEKGFTLLESVIYIGLLIITTGLVINFALNLITSYGKIQASKDAMNNAQNVLDAIVREIRNASKVYTPTSAFTPTDLGQLSLETSLNLPEGETSTFADFYVDNNKLYLKKEGQTSLALTSDRVKVKNLVFTHLTSSNTEAVKIQLTVGYNAPTGSSFDISTTLNATAVLR